MLGEVALDMSIDQHETENKPSREARFCTSLWKVSDDWKEPEEAQPKSRHRRFMLLAVFLPFLSVLSAGPVGAALTENGGSQTSLTILRCLYYPITLLIEHHTFLAKPLRAYLSLWGV